MFEIENAADAKCDQAEKREQLVAPLHDSDVGARDSHCQRKNRLCARAIVAKLRHRGETDYAHYSRRLGYQPRGQGKARTKWRCHPACAHTVSRQALSRISGRQIEREWPR